MFWRRRKLPAEDEPLVPHGLILQAMEESGSELPPDMWDNSPKDVPQSPAEPVEMRLRVSAQPQNRSGEPQPLPNQGKISPPATWPRVDEAEMARRAKGMDTAVSFPYRGPILSSAIPNTDEFEPDAEISEPTRLELVEPPVAPPTATSEVSRLASVLSRIREVLPSAAPLRQRIEATLSRTGTGASRVLQLVAAQARKLRTNAGKVLDATKTRFAHGSKDVIVHSRSGLQHVREGIRFTDSSPVRSAWGRVSSWRVTIRIPAASKKSLTENTRLSRFLVQGIVQRDSRLWSSLGMAALSALLALGFISAVRHYQPDRVEAQPTQAAAAPIKTVQADPQAGAKQSLTATPATPKSLPVASAAAIGLVGAKPSAIVTEKKPASTSPKKPRVRRNTDEDDYVAKDTYVFYGNAGKPHR